MRRSTTRPATWWATAIRLRADAAAAKPVQLLQRDREHYLLLRAGGLWHSPAGRATPACATCTPRRPRTPPRPCRRRCGARRARHRYGLYTVLVRYVTADRRQRRLRALAAVGQLRLLGDPQQATGASRRRRRRCRARTWTSSRRRPLTTPTTGSRSSTTTARRGCSRCGPTRRISRSSGTTRRTTRSRRPCSTRTSATTSTRPSRRT